MRLVLGIGPESDLQASVWELVLGAEPLHSIRSVAHALERGWRGLDQRQERLPTRGEDQNRAEFWSLDDALDPYELHDIALCQKW